jgi:hypothetical protein
MRVIIATLMLSSLCLADVAVDMYQDRTDPKKTVVIITIDGIVETYTVKNELLNDDFINRVVHGKE